MSKREQTLIEKRREPKLLGPITRRQQIAAICRMKEQEIAAAVAERIREVVKQEVELQLGAIKETIMDLERDLEAWQDKVL